MEIEPGARFASYEEFERALRKLQLETNSVYVKKTTKSVDVVNAHLTSGAVKLDEKLEFANVTFTCKHGGNFRTRGTGVWPNQSIIQKLKEETGKVIIAKDVHNMRTNNNRGNDTEKLLQMISDLREKEQATVIPITDESQELRLLTPTRTPTLGWLEWLNGWNLATLPTPFRSRVTQDATMWHGTDCWPDFFVSYEGGEDWAQRGH
ncbi:hypothetical protein MRX96_044684 [Rhipicephalus microplus]